MPSMKTLSAILSLYFLVLSVMPCADPEASESLQKEGAIAVVTQQSVPCGDHEHDDTESCSPLCFCRAVPIHIESPKFELVHIVASLALDKHNSVYKELFCDAPTNPPFHPPKV